MLGFETTIYGSENESANHYTTAPHEFSELVFIRRLAPDKTIAENLRESIRDKLRNYCDILIEIRNFCKLLLQALMALCAILACFPNPHPVTLPTTAIDASTVDSS